jgi:hypothetical protein
VIGPLVTPPAVAVIVAVPEMGWFEASSPLHTTKMESQTPAQTCPDGDTVAIAVFEELKVKVVTTDAFAEFTADELIGTTSPATRESEAGLTLTAATVLLADFPPPQPVNKDIKRAVRAIPEMPWRSFFVCVLRSS